MAGVKHTVLETDVKTNVLSKTAAVCSRVLVMVLTVIMLLNLLKETKGQL